MNGFLKTVGLAAAVILLFIGATYGCAMFGVELEGEVKEEQVENRYEAHQGSQAKIEGTIQTLQNTRKEYLEAETEAMRGAMRQEAINAANRIEDSHIKENAPAVYEWLQKIREERYNPDGELETSPEN